MHLESSTCEIGFVEVTLTLLLYYLLQVSKGKELFVFILSAAYCALPFILKFIILAAFFLSSVIFNVFFSFLALFLLLLHVHLKMFQESEYECTCPAGWAGPQCEETQDMCSSNPCLHGTCTSNYAEVTFACQCISGYSGKWSVLPPPP